MPGGHPLIYLLEGRLEGALFLKEFRNSFFSSPPPLRAIDKMPFSEEFEHPRLFSFRSFLSTFPRLGELGRMPAVRLKDPLSTCAPFICDVPGGSLGGARGVSGGATCPGFRARRRPAHPQSSLLFPFSPRRTFGAGPTRGPAGLWSPQGEQSRGLNEVLPAGAF